MVKLLKRYMGFLMTIAGFLLSAYWFVSSLMAEEEPNLLLGAAYTFIGMIIAVFGWHMWRGNKEAIKRDSVWTCDECGNRISEKDRFCSKCGIEFE